MRNKEDVDEGQTSTEDEYPSYRLVCSYRLLFSVFGFFLFVLLYAQRVGMSVAIVCMVNHTAVAQITATTLSHQDNATKAASSAADDSRRVLFASCSSQSSFSSNLTATPQMDGEFVWEKQIQGHILGAFFYGYTVSQIPGGLLAERFGAKWVLVCFLGLSSLATVLTPLAARLAYWLLIVLRIIVGIGSGVMYPAMHAMLGKWCPPMERSILSGIIYAGGMMGNVIGLPLSGVLCEYGFDGGWGSIFYVIGGASLIWLTVWTLLTSSTPASNRYMSKYEKAYILRCQKGEVSDHRIPLSKVPWMKFVKSGPVWALIIANFCMDWGFYTLLTNIPTFYKEVLNFDIKSNGLYSSLPFIGLWLMINVSSVVVDRLLSARVLSITAARKILTSVGLFMPAIFLVGLSYLDCTQTGLAVAMLVLAESFLGCTFSGYFINHMDIAPAYAGTLMGITNGIAAMSGFIAPPVAAALTTHQTREEWQIVFYISAGMFAFGAIMYNILGSGVIQPWAKDGMSKDAIYKQVDIGLLEMDKNKNQRNK